MIGIITGILLKIPLCCLRDYRLTGGLWFRFQHKISDFQFILFLCILPMDTQTPYGCNNIFYSHLHRKTYFITMRIVYLSVMIPVEARWIFRPMFMMTPSNGNIFRVTGHLCGEFTGPRWIPHSKASDAGRWCFLWSASEWTVGYTIVRLVIWDAIAAPIMTSLLCREAYTDMIPRKVFDEEKQ